MSWYKNILKTSAREDASAEAYLARMGVPEATISYVTTLPPDVKGKVVGLLTRSPFTTVENIIEQIKGQQKQVPQQAPISMPILDKRFNNPQEKQQFFAKIPKEYTQWVTRILNDQNFAFIPSEDTERLMSALKGFTSLKSRDNIALEKDINKYRGLLQLEEAVAKFMGTGPKSGGYLQYNPLSLPGVSQVKTLKDGTLMYKITEADSLKKLGIGTKWCTREDYYGSMAERYINDFGHIYLFTKDSKPIIQMTPDLTQIMDVNDRQVPLPRELFVDFAQQLSKKSKVPVKTIQMFADENKANDPNLILKAIKENGKALQFASDEIRNNPKIVIEALKQNGDAFQYASEELQESEAFTSEAARIEGNFDYRLSYSDMDDELQSIIYGGAKEFGIEPTLIRWDFNEAYSSVAHVIDNQRDSNGGRQIHNVAPILANAAYDADFQKIRAGKFDAKLIKQNAFHLALSKKKNSQIDYDKIRPEYRQQLIAPYLEQAKIEVIDGLKKFDNYDKVNPKDLEDRIQRRAFYIRKEEKEFDSNKITKFEDLDPANQQRFIANAIDRVSEIAKIYDKAQENDENLDADYYDDNDFGYGPEPEEDDFEDDSLGFEAAHREWEDNIQEARDEAFDEYRKNTFPFNFDASLKESIEKIIESKPIKYPSWIYKYFAKASSRPTLLWATESLKRKKAEQAAKKKKTRLKPKKKLRRASGWYEKIKTSEVRMMLNGREKRELVKESIENPNIMIDSDLRGLEFKEDGDLIRIEAYDKSRGIVVGYLNYYTKGNTLQIEMIEVGDPYKRQGLATKLIEKMKQDHPGFKVEPGLVTHQGQPFFKNLKQRKII